MIRIAVISDIKIYCEGLHYILSSTESVSVVGSVSTSKAAMAMVADQLLDVVLLDMTMDASCNLAKNIAEASPATKIVALAVPCNGRDILQYAGAGITCYVLREASSRELVEAVKCAAKGECYCPQQIMSCMFKNIQSFSIAENSKMFSTSMTNEPPPPLQRSHVPQARLTPREEQIALFLTDGMSNKQIANNLCIEVSTVKNHVHNVLLKLEARSRSQAVSILQKMVAQVPTGSLDLDPYLREPV